MSNPIPLAVALQYDKSAVPVPRVIAKGRGDTGEAILALAKEHGIPIEENAVLAEALSQVELGEDIPEALYRAVAEVLIFILRAQRQARLTARHRAADAAEMRERKARAVFQPEPERAVDADMRRPDQRDLQQVERRQQEAERRPARSAPASHVARIVGPRAGPRADQIGGEARRPAQESARTTTSSRRCGETGRARRARTPRLRAAATGAARLRPRRPAWKPPW